MRVAAAPDHIGLAVWETAAGAATEVHFMAMGPTPPPPLPVQQPPVTTPPAATPAGTPAAYAGRVQGVKGTDRDADYTLGVPRDCVQPGQRFRVTLKWKRKKRKGSLFVKVNRTDFYLATKVVKKDTKVPYVHTYTVLVTQPRGSAINLRARAFIKVRRGKAPRSPSARGSASAASAAALSAARRAPARARPRRAWRAPAPAARAARDARRPSGSRGR